MFHIAVIMSVYQNDKLKDLKEAVDSLLLQREKVDIFIQQDGAVPCEIRRYLSGLLSRKEITYLGEREENRGLAYSLNELIEQTKAYRYIARMDADDISLPDRMALQYAFMEQNLEIDVVGGYIEEFGTDMEYTKVVKYPLTHDKMYQFFSKRVPLAHVSAFFRRDFFEKAGLYSTQTLSNEDTLLWLEGFKHQCRFANLDKVVVKVRVSQNFFSRRGGLKKAWSDFKDRLLVIKSLGYNFSSYFYAVALFMVNIAPANIKVFLYQRLR